MTNDETLIPSADTPPSPEASLGRSPMGEPDGLSEVTANKQDTTISEPSNMPPETLESPSQTAHLLVSEPLTEPASTESSGIRKGVSHLLLCNARNGGCEPNLSYIFLPKHLLNICYNIYTYGRK